MCEQRNVKRRQWLRQRIILLNNFIWCIFIFFFFSFSLKFLSFVWWMQWHRCDLKSQMNINESAIFSVVVHFTQKQNRKKTSSFYIWTFHIHFNFIGFIAKIPHISWFYVIVLCLEFKPASGLNTYFNV